MAFSRRNFLKSSVILGTVPLSMTLSGLTLPDNAFIHGVASGDPLHDAVIIWTRITLPDEAAMAIDIAHISINIRWQIATDKDFSSLYAEGYTSTTQDKDFTVKVDVKGLQSNTVYYYRFIIEELDETVISPIGKTKTLPQHDISEVKLAITSCSHFSYGYFNVYARIADMADLDVVLHLGDYLYEYGNKDIYRNPLLWNRRVEPAHEMVSLNDYRLRHATYKSDTDLQRLHQTHPMICIWDDHEFANDAWKHGAENHTEDEGEWQARSQAAIQAYYEWMPIREPVSGNRERAYRVFEFGQLLHLNMLDTRFIGRYQQVELSSPLLNSPDRTLLGNEQEQWLENNLVTAKDNGVIWNLIGQQVQIMQIQLFGNPVNADAWDGYPAARERLLDFIDTHAISNVVFLTGDVHSSWAANIARNPYDGNTYNRFTHDGALAVEIVTPSVTSPSIPVPGLQQLVGDVGQILMPENPHIRYVDLKNRGFVSLTITENQLKADWHHVPIVGFKNTNSFIDKSFKVDAGIPMLISEQ